MNFLATKGYRSMRDPDPHYIDFWIRIQMLNIQSSFEKVQLKYLQKCFLLTQFHLFLAGKPLSKPNRIQF